MVSASKKRPRFCLVVPARPTVADQLLRRRDDVGAPANGGQIGGGGDIWPLVKSGLVWRLPGTFLSSRVPCLKAKVLFQPQPRGAQKRRGVKREKNTLHKFLQRVAWWRGGESGIDHVMGCHVVMLQCCHVVMLQGGNCNRRLLGEGEPWRWSRIPPLGKRHRKKITHTYLHTHIHTHRRIHINREAHKYVHTLTHKDKT